MAFSATNTSAGTGNWSEAGTWTSGVPDIDDQVLIQGGHTVTLNANGSCADLHVAGGVLAFTAGYTLTIKDAAGTHATGEHIRIADDSGTGWNSNGTAASPAVIASASASPTYRVKTLIEDIPDTSLDSRTMDFSYMEFRGSAFSIGNDASYVFFNTGDVSTDGVLTIPPPMSRPQRMNSAFIPGRDYGRVTRLGGDAGALRLNGIIPYASFKWQTLNDMCDDGTPVSLVSQYVHIPRAYIEDLTFGAARGPYVSFTITLTEAH